MKSKLLILLILIIPTTTLSKEQPFNSLCEEAKQEYYDAKKYGAHRFRCKEWYDGTMVSSFKMSNKNYKRWKKSR